MKKPIRTICIVCVCMVAAILWIWRYTSLNGYYSSLYQAERQTYTIGDTVGFEADYIGSNSIANGYKIRVDEFKTVTMQEFAKEFGYSVEEIHTAPDRVAVVYATLFNVNSNAAGIMLTDLQLHSIDNYTYIDQELLQIANPVLKGNKGISLSQETQYEIVLPYALYEEYFGRDTWAHLNSYTWFLHITSHPVEKDIKIQ